MEQNKFVRSYSYLEWIRRFVSTGIANDIERKWMRETDVLPESCEFVPSYENLPVCYCKYSSYSIPKDFEFHDLTIRFKRNRSNAYYDAVFICRNLPNATVISKHSEYNSCKFTTQKELFVFKEAIFLLLSLVCQCRGTEYIVNGEVKKSSRDVREVLWLISERLYSCPPAHAKRLPPLEMFDINALMEERHDHWKHERRLHQIVCDLFPDLEVIRRARPNWLDGLELDVFIPALDLAFEYQGIQHFEPIKHWGGEEKLRVQQEHDARKLQLCNEQGVTLIHINYDENLTVGLVKSRIPERLQHIIIQLTES